MKYITWHIKLKKSSERTSITQNITSKWDDDNSWEIVLGKIKTF